MPVYSSLLHPFLSYRCIRLRLFSAERRRAGFALDQADFRLERNGDLDVEAVRAYWGIQRLRVSFPIIPELYEAEDNPSLVRAAPGWCSHRRAKIAGPRSRCTI